MISGQSCILVVKVVSWALLILNWKAEIQVLKVIYLTRLKFMKIIIYVLHNSLNGSVTVKLTIDFIGWLIFVIILFKGQKISKLVFGYNSSKTNV